MMLLIDALIRISAITMLVSLAIIAVRDLRPSRSWPYLVVACLSTAALFFSLSSPMLALPQGLAQISGVLNVPHLIFIWLFALSIFDVEFRLSKWHVLTGVIYSVPILWFRAFQFGLTSQPPLLISTCLSIGSASLMAYLVWIIIRGRNSDLIETRRRSRIIFAGVLITTTILTAIADVYLIAVWPEWARLIKAATIWPAVASAFLWITHSSKKVFVIDETPKTFLGAELQLCPKDKPLFEKLQRQIKDEKIFLDPRLTITQLAKDLGVTSHRLRGLINQSLGYENFNQFLNRHRIYFILNKIDDPSNDHLSILAIAMDGGFQSLAPFNRAFKKIAGQTPSKYRTQRAGLSDKS